MSKETKASHRKINVDAFEEGIYVEDDSIADNSAAAVEQKSSAVKAFLRGYPFTFLLLCRCSLARKATMADTYYFWVVDSSITTPFFDRQTWSFSLTIHTGQSEKALNAAIADTPYKANKEVKVIPQTQIITFSCSSSASNSLIIP